MFIAAVPGVLAAPLGAGCKFDQQSTLRSQWSAQMFGGPRYKHLAPPEHQHKKSSSRPFL
jgi:hypothetical protein